MKASLTLFFAALLGAASLTSCTTTSHVVEGSTDVAAHAVEKTGHAVAHGVHKVEKHL